MEEIPFNFGVKNVFIIYLIIIYFTIIFLFFIKIGHYSKYLVIYLEKFL